MQPPHTVEDLSDVTVSESEKIVSHSLTRLNSLVKKVIDIRNLDKSWILKFFQIGLFCKKLQWSFRAQLSNLLTNHRRYHLNILGPTGIKSDVLNISPDTYTTRDLSRNTSSRTIRKTDTLQSKVNDLNNLVIQHITTYS